MNNKNHCEIEGIITSDLKHSMIGPKQNFATVFFMLKSEKDPVTKKDGTTFVPGVKVAISAKGKLAEACSQFKKGDLVSVVGELRIDKKEDAITKAVTWFPKIEAISVDALVIQVEYDNNEDLPF